MAQRGYPESNDRRDGQDDVSAGREPVQTARGTMSLPALNLALPTLPVAETGLATSLPASAESAELDTLQDAKRTTAEDRIPAPQPTQPPANPTVLVFADAPDVLKLVHTALDHTPIHILQASQIEAAVTHFKQAKPNVVLLDLSLRDALANQFLDALKAHPATTAPDIIIITRYGDPANQQVSKFQGVAHYLIQPFSAAEVERVVLKALDHPIRA